MNTKSTNIKVLRQNFLRKYQIENDYFSNPNICQEDYTFSDQNIFFPKTNNNYQKNPLYQPPNFVQSFHNINKQQIRSNRRSKSKDVQSAKKPIKIKQNIKPPYQIAIKSISTQKSLPQNNNIVYHSLNTIPCPPSFVKTHMLKHHRSNSSANNNNKPMPKYAAFIMSSCQVKQMAIERRPESARQSQSKQKYSQVRNRKRKSEQITVRKHVNWLQPWQTGDQFDQN